MNGPVYTEPDPEDVDGPQPVDRDAALEQRAAAHAVAVRARQLAAELAEAGLSLHDLTEGGP